MICTVDVDIQSANPDFPLKEWKAFKGSPTSIRIRNVPRKVGAWDITEVNVKCVYPDNTAHMVAAVLTGCVWVATIPASDAVGFVEGGYSIEADGTDERGNVVTGYRLGEGKVTILDVAASAHAVEGIEFMRVFDTKPDAPLKGDFALDVMEFYDGESWRGFLAPADYPTVRTNAATGAAHAAATGNPHGTTAEDIDDFVETVDSVMVSRGYGVDADVAGSVTAQGEVKGQTVSDQSGNLRDAINEMAAHYLTADAQGNAFATAAALKAATSFYYAGDTHIPDKNDYCIVRADEDHKTAAGLSPTTRYLYVGETAGEGEWVYSYTVNETSLTQAQINALNSGATAGKIQAIDGKYEKPADGIPKSDLDADVQASLGKADTALQAVPNLDASKITSGILGSARIPGLAATKITSGTLAAARLPLATSTAKGAVMPVTKTDEMTQAVGMGTDGKLYTKPGGGGGGGGGLTGHKLTVIVDYLGGTTTCYLSVVFADGRVESGFLSHTSENPWDFDYERDHGKTFQFQNVIAFCQGLSNSSRQFKDWNYGYKPELSPPEGIPNYYPLTEDMTVHHYHLCLLAGTLIRLADGTDKPVEDITYDDELLVWDFDNGCQATAKPAWIKVAERTDYAFVNEYASGRCLRTTGRSATGWGHRHFDADRNEFRYTPTTVGDRVMTLDGEDEHVSCRKVFGDFRFYNLITERHFNCYADGVLTSCSLNNLYPVRGMKYVKDGRAVRGPEQFPNAGDLYGKLRLGEVGWSVDAVNEYVNNLKGRMA